MSSFVHINWVRHDRKSVTAAHCPDCKKRTRFLGFHQDYYGWDETCLRCGRRWSDGEWMPLEFERGSRRKSIERAKRHWRRTPDVKIIKRVVA